MARTLPVGLSPRGQARQPASSWRRVLRLADVWHNGRLSARSHSGPLTRASWTNSVLAVPGTHLGSARPTRQHVWSTGTSGNEDQADAPRQDARPALPHHRRGRAHEARRSFDRDDRRVPPQERPVGDPRGRRPRRLLARRRRPADRGRHRDLQGHRRLAEVQGRGGPGADEGRGAQDGQADVVRRRAGRCRRRAHRRRDHAAQAGAEEGRRRRGRGSGRYTATADAATS